MLALTLLVFALSTSVQCAKILGVFTVPSVSHQVVYQPIWKELALRGHEVTVITPNPLKEANLTNLREIDVSFAYSLMAGSDTSAKNNHWQILPMFLEIMGNAINLELNHPEVQKMLADQNTKFDVVLSEFYNPISSGFSAKFNCPLIGVASAGLIANVEESVGIPVHPILYPDLMTTSNAELTFAGRIDSVLYYLWSKYYYNYKMMPTFDAIARKHFGQDIPYLADIESNASMVFLNTNPLIHKARPLPPNIIQLGRMHIKPKKPLPGDLQKFLDGAKEGVVYFSLGSNVKSALIDGRKREAIMSTFAKLPCKVLWKFENDTLPGKPKNVFIKKWLPQQDLLGHPNIRLFVTQGGLQSMEEAISNGVPLLGIPFFGDQPNNVGRMEKLGLGLQLDFDSLDEENFRNAIMEMLESPKYKNRAREISTILNDEPMSGLEKAVWWTEYVIRHKGAAHLRNPAKEMPWVQFLLLDIIGFFLTCLMIVSYVTFKAFGAIRGVFTPKSIDRNKKHKKTL